MSKPYRISTRELGPGAPPHEVLCRLAGKPGAFLLESAAGPEKIGRYWYNKVNPLDQFALKQDGESLSLQFTDMGVEGGLWQPAKYHYELRHCESNELIDSAALTGSMKIAISPDVLSSMDGLSQNETTGDQHRFFCYTLRIEREGKLSKAVRVYLYDSGHGSDRLKIVHIERDS